MSFLEIKQKFKEHFPQVLFTNPEVAEYDGEAFFFITTDVEEPEKLLRQAQLEGKHILVIGQTLEDFNTNLVKLLLQQEEVVSLFLHYKADEDTFYTIKETLL